MIGKVETRGVLLFGLTLAVACRPPAVEAAESEPDTQSVLQHLESPKGICAIVGDTEARLAVDLARAGELLVYVQLADAKAVDGARRAVEAAGLLNTRVYIEQGSSHRVHLADNLADTLVLCGEAASGVPPSEKAPPCLSESWL